MSRRHPVAPVRRSQFADEHERSTATKNDRRHRPLDVPSHQVMGWA